MSNELKIDRPIEGEISRYSYKTIVPQEGPSEFLTYIDSILAVEGVEAIKWAQYTPYFNDGDACEFGTGEINIKFLGNDIAGDYENGYVDSWSLTYQKSDGTFPYRPEGVTNDQAAAIPEINFAQFESVIRENFGDPAEVTATKDGFSVEYYDHD